LIINNYTLIMAGRRLPTDYEQHCEDPEEAAAALAY
jgi:hypothetical protein